METILGIRGNQYNDLTLDEQRKLLLKIPIGSYICLCEISDDINIEYRIIGYELMNIDAEKWLNLVLDKPYRITSDFNDTQKSVIHPGFAVESKRQTRNDKLKQLGI